ncbi:hypothetical protein CSKR_111919 [Clonorchis sinensis]|uniref:Uncharacterized protein n=1 Tax=Clonorchis sinensis TaxID=79923 RepID=A0A3R7FT69_CLOSI|nr:hypothetical protein CSKR_111919 [Clonorchis sinensis]
MAHLVVSNSAKDLTVSKFAALSLIGFASEMTLLGGLHCKTEERSRLTVSSQPNQCGSRDKIDYQYVKNRAVDKQKFCKMHSFANKFGFAKDSPGNQLNLSFVVFPGN